MGVGEVKRMMGPSRRDIGHGSLAENAIKAVIPAKDEFNYTIRVVSEILESNASSSMATVCGATLALLDTGVPLTKAVAGVGVGLIKEGDQEVILTDMIGVEDFLGDMDFKVAGTRDGVTAIQMDIKIDGVTPELMKQAIHQSREARLFVLDKMDEIISTPREELSPYAPRINTIKIPVDKIKDVIGREAKLSSRSRKRQGSRSVLKMMVASRLPPPVLKTQPKPKKKSKRLSRFQKSIRNTAVRLFGLPLLVRLSR